MVRQRMSIISPLPTLPLRSTGVTFGLNLRTRSTILANLFMIDLLVRSSAARCPLIEKLSNEIRVQHGPNPRPRNVETPSEYLLITMKDRSQKASRGTYEKPE